MSFADRVREELCLLPVKHPCCRRAALGALLLTALPTGGKKEYTVRLSNRAVATFAASLMGQQFGKEPPIRESGAYGKRYFDLTFSSPAMARLVERMQAEPSALGALAAPGCDGCTSAILRGLFLFYGTVNDPQKSFHLEFLMPSARAAESAADFFSSIGYEPRLMQRGTRTGVYFKNAAAVEELITVMGAHHIVFDVINSRIEREIRNNENRATNCVAKNIEKSISAAGRQLEAIDLLRAHGRFESLPEGVRTTALLRYAHPDATLDELRALHLPSISKSGLNHRLQRILSEAEELADKPLD